MVDSSAKPPDLGPADEPDLELDLGPGLELESLAESQARAQTDARCDAGPRRTPARQRYLGPGWPILAGLLALVLLGALAEAGVTIWQHLSAPSDAQWAAALAHVKQQLGTKTEPVLFAPHWAEPLGRRHLGRRLPVRMHALSDVDRFGRVWQVSVRGARHHWLKDKQPKQQKKFGSVTVSLFEQEPAKVSYDFTQRVKRARVERVSRGEVYRCPLSGDRFMCNPRAGWNWVGQHLAEVGHRAYRCIFAHAVDQTVIQLTFDGVTVGRKLVVYTGIDDFENRKRNKAPVTLRVRLSGKEQAAITHRNRWPWQRMEIDTSALAGQTHAVRFEVTTPHAYARTFCFSAEMRK